jgi:undecaprenyl-diphosphatase
MTTDDQLRPDPKISSFRRSVIHVRQAFVLRLSLGLFSAALLLVIFGWLISGPLAAPAGSFDESIRASIVQTATSAITEAMRVITRLGSTIVLTAVGTIALIIFVFLRRKREIVIFLIAMAGQILLHYSLKASFQRPRPEPLFDYPIGESYSFPSGHALASFCVYGILAWLITRRMKGSALKYSIWLIAGVLILLIGFSRIYIGVHYATDVFAGYMAALIWTLAVASEDYLGVLRNETK